MKRRAFWLLAILFLSGCAIYRFQHAEKPHEKGYVVSRDDFIMPEYTIGKDNAAPNIKLAKERFKRRRNIVEDYYKRMQRIDNHFKMVAWDSIISMLKIAGGVFRLPFIAISDYRYEHDPEYRARIRRLEEEQDAAEEERIAQLKSELNEYVHQDLEWEGSPKKIKHKARPQKKRLLKQAEIKETRSKDLSGAPVAIIIAKPARGISPLRVRFLGHKSYSRQGRIISYLWDFGDGDTSKKPDPINTYYSGSFGVKEFTITLTVQDDKGKSSQASTAIEVVNR